jgi:hypothetical protein
MSEHLRLQAYYTLTELGLLTATGRKRVARLLHHAGIATRVFGGQRLVFVSDIEARLPELWASVVACERVRAISRVLRQAQDRPLQAAKGTEPAATGGSTRPR